MENKREYRGPMGIFEGYGENETAAQDTSGQARQEREGRITTSWNGLAWTAAREQWDLGMHVGSSLKSEAEAIADLLEWEEMDEDEDEIAEAASGPPLGDLSEEASRNDEHDFFRDLNEASEVEDE